MKIEIDTEARTLLVTSPEKTEMLDLYSPQAFEIISKQWTNVGWSLKYSYGFSWFGRPIIQLPEDMVRCQELVTSLQPDLIIETGVAHGGSLVFYASLCAALGRGRVLGVDIEIRPHNRTAIEQHALSERITLIEGGSTDSAVIDQVARAAAKAETVLVILDSNHSYAHVSQELAAYAPLVTPGSYIVVADGVMSDLEDAPGGRPGWSHDNPKRAAEDFVRAHPEYAIAPPEPPFKENDLSGGVTYWPSGYIRRLC